MPQWGSDFKAHLARESIAPLYLLEWAKIPSGTLRVFGGGVRMSSFETGGHAPVIMPGGSFQGGRLTPRSWSCQPLSFTVRADLHAAPDVRKFAQRGQGVILKVGWNLADWQAFEPVALGTIANITYDGTGWSIHCKGLEGSLVSRFTTTSTEGSLFHDLASTTIDDVTGYGGGGTLNVASTTGFRTDGQGVGVVRVTDDAGDTYFVKYTGTTATSFTGCTVGHFGTSHAATGNGSAVSEVAYTKGHPIEIVRRVLTSTGTASQNGADDILPESWGYGIDVGLLSERDMALHIQYTQPTSGADDWEMVVDAEQTNGQAWLDSFLNGCGYFLTQHQGRITCRAALQPWAQQVSGHFEITDDLLTSPPSYSQWDPNSFVEYEKSRILYTDGTTAGTSAASELDHIPSQGINTHTAGGLWSTSTNASAIVTELVARLKQWDQRTPEVLRLTMRGLWPGMASPGDTCRLQLTSITSRDGSPFTNRDALVLSSSPGWFTGSTSMEVAVLPRDETVPWRA